MSRAQILSDSHLRSVNVPGKVELVECFQEVEYVDEILLYPSCDLECEASPAYPCHDRLRPNLRRNCRRAPLRQINRWRACLVVTIVVMLSGCLLLAISGCADAIPGVPTQALIVKPGSVAFGAVALGDTTSASVSLVNQSPAPVEIMQLKVTGQSFSVGGQSNLPVTVAAGGTYSVNVQFDPTAPGVATGQLTIGNNSTGGPTEMISLSGTGTVANSTSTPSALSCSNATMTGTGTDTCLLTLSAPAPSGGLSVALASSNPAVTLPAAVTVPANATSTGFTATVASVSSAQAVTLTASEGGVSRSFALQLNAATATLSINATSVAFGDVTLNTPATQPVILTSTGTVPVTVNAATVSGAGYTISGATFPITLNPGQAITLNVRFDPTVTGVATGQLTIASNSSSGSTAVVALTGTGQVANSTSTPSALSCSNATMTGTGTDTCLLTLSAPAPSGGLSVALASSNPAVTLPAAVTVPANATSTGFTATVASVSSAQAVTLTASEGGVSRSFALQLNAATATLSINATSVAFGDVTLNTPATQPVILTSTGTVPVTVNAATVSGAGYTISGATFPITLNPGQAITLNVRFDPTVTGVATGQLTIASNSSSGSTAVVALTGTGQVANSTSTPSALSCSNATMTGTGTDTCLLTLSAPAPSGGLSVALASSNPAVTLPAAVTVPANATSTGFTATVASVSSAQAVTLTASEGGVSRSFALQLNAATATLSINATSVAFGDVTLNTPATQPVILTSTGTVPVTVNAATVSGAGYTISGATFPITLNPGQAITLNVQFDPTVTGVATGQLTIASNSSSGSTAVVALTGTGQVVTHEVDLSWDAPSSSPDPVAGYEVYRSPSGSSAYQLINSSPDTQTTYVDTMVQSGLSYDYIVKSVDASGNESTASNMAAVTIP